MEKYFIDTSFLIALETHDDMHHQSALNFWRELLVSKPSFLSTNFIIDEVATYFNSRNKHFKAVEIGNCLLKSFSINLIHVDESVFLEGWDFFSQHDDKSYSLTDCISFVVMNRFNTLKSLTFDRHFEQAGFLRLPKNEC